MGNKNIIEVSNLSRFYCLRRGGEVRAVDGVVLKIPEGEFLTILGPSGSGKTTLLNMLGGLDRPTAGEVTLDGLELSRLSEGELVRVRREKVGFVFQAFNLLPVLSAVENVELPLLVAGVKPGYARQQAREVLALVGLVSLLLTGMGRQRARQRERQPSPSFQRWQRWGSLAGLALILLGLFLMATAK